MGGGWAFFRQVCIFEVVSALRLKQPNTIELGGMAWVQVCLSFIDLGRFSKKFFDFR